ncbi:DNA-binding MarR family transcriptional regulator [Luteimonas cucumeris]|uniref:DNA-binding MarR family transcriptional regulator n=1 Tax=Luteimonas cucumeris TaxID=985012 RepID=A0A562LAX9_9GAMM|nr:MarR family transcriptional regulator [Luteimonas cucumeris]TWI04790.1 DNA-binding MarR family transcriptional regulator [Luteimonas cucumeris]
MNTSVPCSGSTLGLLFRQVRDAMWARMERELAGLGHDLTFSQYITLKKLADGTAGVTDLARAAELNPGAMTRLLDKLEAKGLVVRSADPDDRRAINIQLTDAGLVIWQDINKCGQRVREQAMSGMGEDERTQLTRLLEQVRDNLTSSDS